MSLIFHISIHIFLGLLAGLITWRIYEKYLFSISWILAVFFSALFSGVAVDIDHFIDYFLAFGFQFNFDYFLSGYQFLKSDRLYILFHAWEYVVILTILAFLIRNKMFKAVFFSLALGLSFHLVADVWIDNVPAKTYSILFRAKNNFELQKMVYIDHWEKHQIEKTKINFN